MDELKNKIGTTVKNDGKELTAALGVRELHHTGNFCFEASYGGMSIAITTEPQDDDGEFIKVTDIRIHPDVIRRLGITYHMIRGKETAETYIELPISQKRYDELKQGLQPDNKVWHEVRDALANLTFLQGYDELGEWSLELELSDYDGRTRK